MREVLKMYISVFLSNISIASKLIVSFVSQR